MTYPSLAIMRCRSTINIHVGRKLAGKSRDEILEAVLAQYDAIAVQQSLDVIRVTLKTEGAALAALSPGGVYLFGMWMSISGGPPVTIVHLFDYPYEEDDEPVVQFFSAYGRVKDVREQRYISKPDIYTGTRLVDLVFASPPPRIAQIGTYQCRIWYRGQPIICNLCEREGHKSSSCPDKDKCRLCHEVGHIARNCPNPWGTNPVDHGRATLPVAVSGAPESEIPASVASASEASSSSVVTAPLTIDVVLAPSGVDIPVPSSGGALAPSLFGTPPLFEGGVGPGGSSDEPTASTSVLDSPPTGAADLSSNMNMELDSSVIALPDSPPSTSTDTVVTCVGSYGSFQCCGSH